jgi:hypothetical protein
MADWRVQTPTTHKRRQRAKVRHLSRPLLQHKRRQRARRRYEGTGVQTLTTQEKAESEKVRWRTGLPDHNQRRQER